MLILGIESSCDDTSVALVDCNDQGCFVVKETAASQIDLHKKYGGVVPELAGRAHAEKIVPLIEETLRGQPRPDAIAVTAGPGLITGLIVGVEAARTLSWVWGIPLIAVNHIWGHVHSVEVKSQKSKVKSGEPDRDPDFRRDDKIEYPALALIVSGGHTELILMNSPSDYKKIGATRDDAAGECFDKVAKLLELEYPGGPKISALAKTGRTDAIDFPRPMLGRRGGGLTNGKSATGGQSSGLDFSFAGLKTAALYWLRDNQLSDTVIASEAKQSNGGVEIASSAPAGLPRNDKPTLADFCASFEQAIVDVLVGKTLKAAKQYNPKTIILGGGVAANKKLRETLAEAFAPTPSASPPRAGGDTRLLVPTLKYCMDNAAMIAVAGYYEAQKQKFADWPRRYRRGWRTIVADPNWEIE